MTRFAALIRGETAEAVEAFHCALALRPDDALSAELLTKAMMDFTELNVE